MCCWRPGRVETPRYFIATVGGARTFGSTKTLGFVTTILTSTVYDTFRRISCDLCAMRKQHSLHKTVQNRLKPGVLSRTVRVPVGERKPRCTLVFTGFLPRALVAQRIEQKTSNLLAAGSIPAEGTDNNSENPVLVGIYSNLLRA